MYPIRMFVIRVPGETSWATCDTEKDAMAERDKANRICRPGHRVYAEHMDGTVTGPYDDLPGS